MKSTKLYAQASRQTASTLDVLKIKESFLALNAKQINRVNNIIKGNPNLKPHTQITTKRPSRKQVIVPIAMTTLSLSLKTPCYMSLTLTDFLEMPSQILR